jgi:hypothetical protein
MLYRVHYMANKERRTDQIEASSPQEAMVKFRHTCSDHDRYRDCQIMSISAEPVLEEAWQ